MYWDFLIDFVTQDKRSKLCHYISVRRCDTILVQNIATPNCGAIQTPNLAIIPNRAMLGQSVIAQLCDTTWVHKISALHYETTLAYDSSASYYSRKWKKLLEKLLDRSKKANILRWICNLEEKSTDNSKPTYYNLNADHKDWELRNSRDFQNVKFERYLKHFFCRN